MNTIRCLTAILLLAACGDSDTSDGEDGGVQGGDGSDARPECATDECADYFAVAQIIEWPEPDDNGQVDGLNIDDRVSDLSDAQTCNIPDYTAPDGREGIDSQSSILIPLYTEATGEAIAGYTATAISDGDLLMMVGLLGVDDPDDDDCVRVTAFPGMGSPLLGTDGLLAPDQTFDVNPDYGMPTSDCAEMKDGEVTAGPFETVMPLYIVELSADLHVHDTHIRARLKDDGSMDVITGGAVETDQLFTLVDQAGDDRIIDIANTTIHNLADIKPGKDDICEQMSQTLKLTTTRAFLF